MRCGSGDSGSLTGCERGRTDTKSGCLARGRLLPKPRKQGCAPTRESRLHGRRRAVVGAGGEATEPSHWCSRVARHSEVGAISNGSSSRASREAHGAEGRHPRRGAPNSGAGVAVEEGASRLRVRWSRAGRLAITECIEVESTEAGDGENPRPLDVSLATRMASERAQKARDWENAGRRTDSTMHERASSHPSQRSEDRAVTVRGRAAPDDASTASFDGT